MEETSGNMAPPGAIESQEAHAVPPAATPMEGDAHDTSSVEVAASNGVLQASGASDTSPNDAESAKATSTATADAASTPREDNEEAKSDEDVVVNLKFLHRERVTLRCPATIVVADLKQRVRDAYIQAVQQEHTEGGANGENDHEPEPATQPLRLIYKGKVLKDDQTLASYSFLSDDTIHAVFSRAAAAPAPPPSEQTSAAATAPTRAASSSASASVASSENGDDESGDVVTFARFELPQGADVGQFISSVLSSTLNAYGDSENPPTLIFPNIPLGGGNSATRTTAPTPSAASAPTPRTTATPAASSTTAQASAPRPVRSPEATRPPTTERTPATPSGSSQLLNEAAALRRSIPALELAPLSRPPELSTEMYNLGNAMRESGDTYLAIHRQLQFVATRFLQENHLGNTERERLRNRVQQLIPVMQSLSTLSTSVAQQLASSSYGSAPATRNSSSQAQPATATAPGSQQPASAPSTSATPLLSLSSFMNLVTALAEASQTPLTAAPAGSTSAPGTATAAGDANQAPTYHIAPVSAYPLRSLGYKLQQRLATRPDHLSLSFDEFVGVVSALVIDHITQCCAPGIDQFVQTAGEEVETAFKSVEESQGRVYSRVESRGGIVRASLRELAQMCAAAVDEVDEARNAKLRSWLRRSCSHLFVEVSENLDARTAAKTTAEVLTHVLTASPTPRTPFHEAVVTRTSQYLESRFAFA